MRIAYLDCFSGVAGDMLLGALIDAGLPPATLESLPTRLGLKDVAVVIERVTRRGVAATHVNVQIAQDKQPHRHLRHIVEIIDAADIDADAKADAKRVFQRLAEAEAAVHGCDVQHVHFHEVGAADAIVDIVGCCVGLRELGVERVVCSPIPPGSGTVKCAHGVIPVPAPATARLLEGVPLAACAEPGELATPTGVALAVTLSAEFGALPPMTIAATGFGAGTREGQTQANVLRVILGDAAGDDRCEQDVVTVLEAQMDDAPGQQLGYALETLLEAGALDAYTAPITMKKSRPGFLLTVLCRSEDAERLEGVVFRETTTFGVRRTQCRRSKLSRSHERVETEFGAVRVKVGRRGDEVVQAWPEYEDCAELARTRGVSLRAVQAAALAAWRAARRD